MTAPAHRPRVAFLGYAHDARGGIAQFGRRLAETVSERADVRLVGYRKLYPRFTRPGRQAAGPEPPGRGLAGERSRCPGSRGRGGPRAAISRPSAPTCSSSSGGPRCSVPSVRSILRRARRAGTRTLVMATTTGRTSGSRSGGRSPARRSARPTSWRPSPSPSPRRSARCSRPPRRTSPRCPHIARRHGRRRAADWDARLGAPAGPVILFFGNVRAYKGLEDLVAAMPAVLERVDATLVVAGTFMEPLERYQEQARALGVEHHVTFLPDYLPDEEVAGLFRARRRGAAVPVTRRAAGCSARRQCRPAGRRHRVGPLPAIDRRPRGPRAAARPARPGRRPGPRAAGPAPAAAPRRGRLGALGRLRARARATPA